jgi:hypothetical protein
LKSEKNDKKLKLEGMKLESLESIDIQTARTTRRRIVDPDGELIRKIRRRRMI